MASFFQSLTSSVLAASLALAPVVAQADTGNDPEWQRLASKREAERYNVAMAGASIRAGGAMVAVNAPMSVVHKVVTDYAHYSDFMPRFQKSRVTAKSNGNTDVYLQVPILHGAATVWSLTRFTPAQKEGNGERIEGKMVEGNVDDLRAVWHLRPVDDTHTVLKLELLIVPKLPLPGAVVTPELAFASDQAVSSSRDRSEAKARSATPDDSSADKD